MLNIFYGRLAAWSLFTFAVPAAANPVTPIPSLFQWKFADSTLSTSLPTCTPLGIIIESVNMTTNGTIGVPPYYMISFAIDSTPVTQLIGEDQNNLQWCIIQPVGSRLLLSVVDSQGNPGGSAPELITVTPGQTTQCVTSTTLLNEPEFTVSSNVTGNLNAFSPWGLTISGGSSPYVVTLLRMAEALQVVFNVTMQPGITRFTFTNLVAPGGQMIAGVSDRTGRWANGTPAVNFLGSASATTASAGAVTASVTTAAVNVDWALAHLGAIVAAIVAIIVILILWIAVSLVVVTIKKRRQQRQQTMFPTQFSALSEQARGGVVFHTKLERLNVEAPPHRGYGPAGRITLAGGRSIFPVMENPFITEQERQTTNNRLTRGTEASVGSLPSYMTTL